MQGIFTGGTTSSLLTDLGFVVGFLRRGPWFRTAQHEAPRKASTIQEASAAFDRLNADTTKTSGTTTETLEPPAKRMRMEESMQRGGARVVRSHVWFRVQSCLV